MEGQLRSLDAIIRIDHIGCLCISSPMSNCPEGMTFARRCLYFATEAFLDKEVLVPASGSCFASCFEATSAFSLPFSECVTSGVVLVAATAWSAVVMFDVDASVCLSFER